MKKTKHLPEADGKILKDTYPKLTVTISAPRIEETISQQQSKNRILKRKAWDLA